MMRYLLALLLLLAFVSAQRPAANILLQRLLESEKTLIIDGEFSESLIFLNRFPKYNDYFIYPAIISPRLVKDNYSIKIIEAREFLNREVQILELKPNNNMSPYWQFAIDKSSGSRLAYKQIAADGQILAEGSYTKIDKIRNRENPKRLLNPRLPELQQSFYRQVFANVELPEGYIPVKLARSTIGQNKIPALRITYLDGLNTLILLLVLNNPDLPKNTEHMQSINLDKYSLVAIGPLPENALKAWLENFRNAPINTIEQEDFKKLLRGL